MGIASPNFSIKEKKWWLNCLKIVSLQRVTEDDYW